MSIKLYNRTAFLCSELITKQYSTSFSLGIQTLDKQLHFPIYAIYGFVRYADEIVDTFHDHDKRKMLAEFEKDTWKAIEEGISMNSVLHAFQLIVNQYEIPQDLIKSFLKSMEMDLDEQQYDKALYEEYIYGSAEVVGLMCLKVFCEGDEKMYESLKEPAQKLGAAFQKVNFLRDMKSDYKDRGRVYFPGIDFENFTCESKRMIEAEIKEDFNEAYAGILQLPKSSKLGVYLAYIYYLKLFNKIKSKTANNILSGRIRISNIIKFNLLVNTYVKGKLNIL